MFVIQNKILSNILMSFLLLLFIYCYNIIKLQTKKIYYFTPLYQQIIRNNGKYINKKFLKYSLY